MRYIKVPGPPQFFQHLEDASGENVDIFDTNHRFALLVEAYYMLYPALSATESLSTLC